MSNLRAMLPTPPQPVAGAASDADAGDAGSAGGAGGAGLAGSADAAATGAGEMERFGEATEFINWAGRGAADLILPGVKENSDDGNDEDNDDNVDNVDVSHRNGVNKVLTCCVLQ